MVSSEPIGEGRIPMNVELADLCIFSYSAITFVCRGRDMALEVMPECKKTKTECVVLVDSI
jgi:hypothetical protein